MLKSSSLILPATDKIPNNINLIYNSPVQLAFFVRLSVYSAEQQGRQTCTGPLFAPYQTFVSEPSVLCAGCQSHSPNLDKCMIVKQII